MESDGEKIPCRLAAFDLDGTLLNSEHALSGENCDALRNLAATDVLVVLVSGRMHRSIQPISDQIGLENPIISYNGGMVQHATTGEVYHHTPVPADYAMEVVDTCRQRHLHLNFCLNDELYVLNVMHGVSFTRLALACQQRQLVTYANWQVKHRQSC